MNKSCDTTMVPVSGVPDDVLVEELEAAVALASQEVQAAVPAIVRALKPAMAQLHQSLLLAVIEQLNSTGLGHDLQVRITADGPVIVGNPLPSQPEELPTFSDEETVRLTVRLPQSLRDRINREIDHTGESLNSWLVQAAAEKCARGAESSHRVRGRRVTGWSI